LGTKVSSQPISCIGKRAAGYALVLMPPWIVSEAQISEIVEKTAQAIKAAA
jgi:adenosylmethionine-8-amino-7-oxononanoate aminotransferase